MGQFPFFCGRRIFIAGSIERNCTETDDKGDKNSDQ
jgi:hypothetical protein